MPVIPNNYYSHTGPYTPAERAYQESVGRTQTMRPPQPLDYRKYKSNLQAILDNYTAIRTHYYNYNHKSPYAIIRGMPEAQNNSRIAASVGKVNQEVAAMAANLRRRGYTNNITPVEVAARAAGPTVQNALTMPTVQTASHILMQPSTAMAQRPGAQSTLTTPVQALTPSKPTPVADKLRRQGVLGNTGSAITQTAAQRATQAAASALAAAHRPTASETATAAADNANRYNTHNLNRLAGTNG